MERSIARPIVALATVIAIIAGCAADSPTPSQSTPTVPPSVVPATATADPAAEVFGRVASSVVFVATDVGTGSGLIVDDRHVLTNAHVIRPYRSARVILADGTALAEARVAGWDLEADLALLDTGRSIDAPDLPTSQTEARTGERVYLVGYPLASTAAPSGRITEGIISGAPFEWVDGLTFHQTDAVIEDGQSGGVLVDGTGALLGITGGSRGQFAIALDAGDALGRAAGLLAGEDVDGTGDHLLPIPGNDGDTDIEAVVRHRADVHVWLVPGDPGDPPVTVSLTSDRPVGLYGMAAAGRLGHAAGPPGEKLSLSIPFDATGPYAVKVESVGQGEATIRLRSSVGLTTFEDADDGRLLEADRPLVGAADYAGDLDWYRLTLTARERVTIRASAAAMDPALFVDRADSGDAPLARGHDDGGPLGGDDIVEFDAPSAGEYLVVVSDARFQGAGAYRLTVEEG